MTSIVPVVAFACGALGWSLSEYALHRFAGHGRLARRPGRWWWITPRLLFIVFHEEHVAHHRDPTCFAPTWKKGVATVLLVPVFGALAAILVGTTGGIAFGVGYAGTYLAYEILHRRIHTHAPLARYFASMRRHHLHHHVAPKVNHGVTSPIWDRLFRTHVRADRVRLPRSIAPAWIIDPSTGEPRGEFATQYELVGRASAG